MNIDGIISQIITTGIATVLSTGFLSILLNWKISSFQKKEDSDIEISKNLLENVFNEHDFVNYNDIYGKITNETTHESLNTSFKDIKGQLDSFKKVAVKEKLSSYIYELKDDSNRIERNIDKLLKLLSEPKIENSENKKIDRNVYSESNKIVYQYNYFVARYNNAIRKYRYSIGSKATPEQNKESEFTRIVFLAFIMLIICSSFIGLALIFDIYFKISLLMNFSIFFALVFLLFTILIFVMAIIDDWKYRFKTSTFLIDSLSHINNGIKNVSFFLHKRGSKQVNKKK